MRKTRYILLLVGLLLLSCEKETQTTEEVDIHKYISRMDSLYNADPDEILHTQQRKADREKQMEQNLALARAYYLRGKWTQATLLAKECMSYYDSLSFYNPPYIAHHLMALRTYADALRSSGEGSEAVNYYREGSKIARELGRYDLLIEDMSYVYNQDVATGRYSDAIDGYENLLKVCDDNRLKEQKFGVLEQLISTYLTIGDREKATELLDQMVQLTNNRDTLRNAQIDLKRMEIAIESLNEQTMRVMTLKLKKMLLDKKLKSYYGTQINTLLAEYYLHKHNNVHAQIHIDNLIKEGGGKTDYYMLLQAHLEKNRDDIEQMMQILESIDKNDISKDITLYERYLQLMSDGYYKMGKYEKAYNLYHRMLAMVDVLQREKIAQDYAYKNLDFRRDTTILAQHYDLQQREIELDSLKIWRRVFIIVAVAVIVVSLIIFFYMRMVLMRRRVEEIAQENDKLQRAVMRQTSILKRQEEELTVKKNEMRGQIEYASRIQFHILPDIATFDSPYIKDAFIIFRPCQIVSGDFYWCKEKKGKQIIVCADATGHGIPGAFVAMVCATILNSFDRIEEENTTVKILEYLDENIRTILHGNNTTNENDSLDLSILCINNNTGKMAIGTARQNAYLVKKNGEETVRISGAHRSIGDTHPKYMTREFTETTLDVDDDDMLYLTSDGYESQLGGGKYQKLKRTKMIEIFESIKDKDINQQKIILEEELDKWKGDNDQTDDVTVIGIRLMKNK